MTNSKFALLLRQCRDNSGLTQQQVAKALNVERSTYAYYETGTTHPSCDFVLKISKIYNVDYRLFMDSLGDSCVADSDDECDIDSSLVRNEKIYNLSPKEQNLILAYRAMSAEKKENVLNIVTSA